MLLCFGLLFNNDKIKDLSLFGYSQISRTEVSDGRGNFYNSYIVWIVYCVND